MRALGRVKKTERGFERVEFEDHYGAKCSLQASSLAERDAPGTSAVWLGPNNADPKVMVRDAKSVGVDTWETCGWVPYPIPEKVSLNTRAHLNRKQVAALIQHLQSWLLTGSFELGKQKGKQ